jgi:hypothetical protein
MDVIFCFVSSYDEPPGVDCSRKVDVTTEPTDTVAPSTEKREQ